MVACASDFDTTRAAPPRGTLGREMYTLVCDRVAANALREDVSGVSWHPVCHADASASFADKVDTSKLVPLDPDARDADGKPVPLDAQAQHRAYRVARIEALARDRQTLIGAFDAAFPDEPIAVKDGSCAPAGQESLHKALADVLARLVDLENDRTIPLLTEAIARVMNDVKAAPDIQDALARFDARQGYRPLEVAMGSARPILGYPRFVPFAQSILSIVSSGGHAQPQMQQLLAVGREEMRTSVAPAPLAALTSAVDANIAGWQWLSRPRTSLEMSRAILLAGDPAFDVGLKTPRFVVARDARAYASVKRASGSVPPPFVDSDGDGLADVDALGRFVTSDGKPAPSPFFSPDGANGVRDDQGRAPVYDYLDVGTTLLPRLESDVRPLADPDPTHGKETLMNVLSGAYVLFGDRDKGPATSQREYPPDPPLAYSAFHPETSPLVDLVYALGVMLADPATDDVLALGRALMTDHPSELARLVGLLFRIKTIADSHPEAHIPGPSTFWDEMLDVLAKIAAVQDNVDAGGILEDLTLAFGDDRTPKLQNAFGAYTGFCDGLTYDHGSTDCSDYTDTTKCRLNGAPWNLASNDAQPLHVPCDRSKPDVGTNRSALQMFMQILHDGKGISACTKDGAVAHVKFNVPPFGVVNFDYPTNSLSGVACALVGAPPPPVPMPKCGILRIRDVSALLLDVALNRAQFEVRDPCLNALMNSPLTNIVGGADAFLQQQSGIVGFSTHPTVAGVGRLFYFEIPDAGQQGDLNPATRQTYDFLKDIIDPPQTTACAYTPFTDTDGAKLNLHDCSATPQYDLRHRDPGALFPLEQGGFIEGIQPLAAAFDDHGQAILFVDLFDTLHLHWGSAQQTADICDPSLPKSDDRWCSQDGAVSYEPLLYDVLTNTDLLQSLHDFVPILKSTTVAHCDAQDPKTRHCTTSHAIDGIRVLANAMRVMVDPARNQGLTDRFGVKTARRNDGTTNPQVTPIYLFIDALKGVDDAFDKWLEAHPGDDRQARWRAARSQLVDTFFSVKGGGAQSTWANAAIPAFAPKLTDVLQAQILAHCPDRSSRAACPWGPQDLPRNMSDSVGGPTFAAVMDLVEAIRSDDTARAELQRLVQYLLDAGAPGDTRAATMTASVDLLQVLSDDANLSPFYHAAADALGADVRDDHGAVVQRGAAGAAIEVLARVFTAARDTQGHEDCGSEDDPNGAIAVALRHLVTPAGANQQAPIETLIDVVADVNRAHPDQTTKLAGADYGNMANEIGEFMLDPASGLEQVYTVVREATKPK